MLCLIHPAPLPSLVFPPTELFVHFLSSCKLIASEHGSYAGAPRCPASLMITGRVREKDSPSALSPARQANRRHSQIRIMRGTLAWTDWNDTHTGVWSHAHTHTQLVSHGLSTVCLFVCLSVRVSVCLFICIFLFWHHDSNLISPLFAF